MSAADVALLLRAAEVGRWDDLLLAWANSAAGSGEERALEGKLLAGFVELLDRRPTREELTLLAARVPDVRTLGPPCWAPLRHAALNLAGIVGAEAVR